MKQVSSQVASLALVTLVIACGGSELDPAQGSGSSNSGPNETTPAAKPEEDHPHDEVSLGTVTLGDYTLELAQGHGAVVAGEEAHLVVKLPYSDSGSTIVRAWIGSMDRTLSYVGKGEYAPSHDDYDVHATAPDPLPEGHLWWIELERPDGTKLTGSAQPLLE